MTEGSALGELAVRRRRPGRLHRRARRRRRASASRPSSTPRCAGGRRGREAEGRGRRMNPMFEAELLAHLDEQIASARRLLELVLAQGEAIRARDVEARARPPRRHPDRDGPPRPARAGPRRAAALGRRRAGRRPGRRSRSSSSAGSSPPRPPARRRERSAELRGLLAEIAREHGINRALMRQELAFLSHLTRLVGHEPEGGYRAGGDGRVQTGPHARPAGSAARRPLYSRARPPGLATMAISSFYGLQTSLRGLLAQQRALDITGAQHRQRLDRRLLAPGGRAGRLARAADPGGRRADGRRRAHRLGRRRRRPTAASATPSSTSSTAARPRSSASGRRARRASTGPSSRSPSRARTASTRSSRSFWSAWSDLAKAPQRPGRPAGAARAGRARWPARSHTVDRPDGHGRRARRARSTTRSCARRAPATPAARSTQIATEIAQLNETIKRFVTAGDTPNDLLDRRDLLLDQLAALRPGVGHRAGQRLAAGRLRRRSRPRRWSTTRRSTGRRPPRRARGRRAGSSAASRSSSAPAGPWTRCAATSTPWPRAWPRASTGCSPPPAARRSSAARPR